MSFRAGVRAVLVYSQVGGGHLSAARALAAELEASGGVSVRLVDAYAECGRFPLPYFPAVYARLARRHPRLWAAIYYGAETRMAPRHILSPFLRHGFARLMAEEKPHLVVSVLPVVNGLLADAARTVGARTEVVLTDWHAVHRLWVDDGIQQYTVATESARLECIGYGAPPELVDVVGIPVRRDFAVAVDRVAVRQQRLTELGLDPARFTILAMAGAEGSPRALANLSGLARLDLDAQLVVICGRNEQLRRRVEALPGRMPRRAVGFVEHVADLMRSADILVTKAGGLTLAEAFCCGVPLVVDDALPGQEAGNLAYVLDAGAAEFGQTPAALARIIPDLMRHPDKRTALVAGGGRLARPAAAREIAANLLRRLDASGA